MSDQARYQRFVQDAALTVSAPFPAAGAAAVYTPFLDLGAPEPGSIVDDFDVLIQVPATPNLVTGKNLYVQIEDSALGNSSDAAPIVPIGPVTITGPANGGGAATSVQFKLPATVREFIALKLSEDAGGGDATELSATLALVF